MKGKKKKQHKNYKQRLNGQRRRGFSAMWFPFGRRLLP